MDKKRSSTRQKAELSGLRLGRGANRERSVAGSVCLRREGTPRLEAPHLGRLCGGQMFLALTFWLLLGQAKSNIKEHPKGCDTLSCIRNIFIEKI